MHDDAIHVDGMVQRKKKQREVNMNIFVKKNAE